MTLTNCSLCWFAADPYIAPAPAFLSTDLCQGDLIEIKKECNDVKSVVLSKTDLVLHIAHAQDNSSCNKKSILMHLL